MQLSTESYRTRWIVLAIAWTLVAAYLLAQAAVIRDYLSVAGGLGLRGRPAVTTPLQQIYPVFAADAQTWVRHAISLTEGNGPQLRHTFIDNAPAGREVHWNSAWAWTIATGGYIYRLFTAVPLPIAIERATVWVNPLTLLTLIVLMSLWATRRAGLIAGLMVIAAMACTDRMFEGFFPTYVDHHGLLTVSAFATMLGAIFMGGGWWQPAATSGLPLLPTSPELARRAAAWSGFCGALGIWVSAASLIPPIAMIGAAGVLVVLIQGRYAQQQGATFDPQVWRVWSRAGALASFIFYVLEYFPSHLGVRLEPNHPLHALAWLGGGELVAQICSRWLGAPEERWSRLRALVWPVLAVAAVPAFMIFGGAKVFAIADPFMASLHKYYIQEFLPLWVTLRNFTPRLVFQLVAVDNLPLIFALAALSFHRRESPILLWFATIAALLFNALGWWQSRWLLNASGVQVCLAMVVLGVLAGSYSLRVRWIIAALLISALYLPTAVLRYIGSRSDSIARRVSPKDASGALNRDIAAVLRSSQPTGEITLLTSPNASTGIGYYGRFKTLGTLYWENGDGLKAAGSIFSAQSEEEAAKLLREHKVTHIALVSEENFIAEYYRLLHPGAKDEEIKKSFGWRLISDKMVPQWLQMIPYKVPDDLAVLNISVMLFKVNFEQSLPEALYNVALAQSELGGYTDAEKTLDLLTTKYPQFPQPWLRKAEILLRRHDWAKAAEAFQRGINLSPAAEQPALYTVIAGSFYKEGQHAIAIDLYQRALGQAPTADIACYLAWVLATSKEDSLRKPRDALHLAQEAVKVDANNVTYLNTLGAALAANDRFPEAIAATDRALANARVQGNADGIQTSEQNLAVLKSGQPIRR